MNNAILTRVERRALDARFRRPDESTHHWPGCAMPLPLCRCNWADPDTSEFGRALREGDRAIAAMVADTSTNRDPEPIESTTLIVDYHGYHEVQIRPGFTILRPLNRVLAFSHRPANLSTILNNIK